MEKVQIKTHGESNAKKIHGYRELVFYLEDYISTDDIIIETFDGLKSSEQRDVFLELGTPCFV